MAGEIFVGSVAVSVVPDLRGFNTKIRNELVPAARDIGKDMGKEISKNISEQLDFGKITASAYAKSGTAMRDVARTMGTSYGRAFKEGFNREVKDFNIKVDIDARTLEGVRRKIKLAFKDAFTVKVKADIDQASFAKLAVAAKLAGAAGGGGGGSDIDKLINDLFGRGGGRRGGGFSRLLGIFGGGGGGAAGALGSAASGAEGAFLRGNQLQGVVQGFQSLPPQAQAAIGGVAAVSLPFIGQQIGSAIVGGFGTVLAGMGIAGAFGLGGQNVTPQQMALGQARLTAAQDRQAAAQDRLNQLQNSGTATTTQLASAHASLASASAGVISAQQNMTNLQDSITPGQQKVRQSFSDLSDNAQASLAKIGESFIPVMLSIANTAEGTLSKLTPVFAGAVKQISGPFKLFADAIIRTFGSPQVQSSITAVGKAFGGILTALTPDLPGIINSFADAIERIANAVAKNPKAFADFINFLLEIPILMLNAIAFLTDMADYIEFHFTPAIQDIIKWLARLGVNWSAGWKFIRDTVRLGLDVVINIVMFFVNAFEGHWRKAFGNIGKIAEDFGKQIVNLFTNLMPFLASIIRRGLDLIRYLFDESSRGILFVLDSLRHSMAALWDISWNNTIGRAIRGWHDLMGVFTSLKNDVIGFFSGAASWLVTAGEDIIKGMFAGIGNQMGGVDSWIKNTVVDPVINSVKHFFGIASPSTVMEPIGKNLILGILQGMFKAGANIGGFVKQVFGGWPAALGGLVSKGLVDVAHLPQKALQALGSVAGKVGGFASSLWHKVFGGGGGGVQQWAGTVMQALAMLHLPFSLAGQVLYQMQTESGGNPNAINLWDINAKMGDPSRGLMQVIGGTFAAYHVPGTSANIYDPLANIAAAINYAVHRYGPTLLSGGMGMGSGHGYASGTPGAAPGWAWVGEAGPELIHFGGGEQVIAVARGYATGTSVGTLEAEISVLNARIAELNQRYATYAAGSAGQLGRNLTAAQINVDRSRIADLQARIFALEHPGQTAVGQARTAAARERAALAALRAQERAAARMANAGATVAADFAKITTRTTAATFASDQALMLKDLRFYLNPTAAAQRSRLVIAQIKHMQDLQIQIAGLDKTMTDAQNYQKTVLANLQANTGLGAIGIQGRGTAQGRSLLTGLNVQISSIRAFGASIANLARAGGSQALLQQVGQMAPSVGTAYANTMTRALKKLHGVKAPAALINQLVALGPDAALAYADALAGADKRTLAQIYTAEGTLGTTQTAVARGIASAAYGGGYNTSKNFLSGLKAQQAELNKVFAQAGKALAKEAIYWFNVPTKQRPYGYQHGGWISEPVSGVGMYTGSMYLFAEAGREYVVPENAMQHSSSVGGVEYHAHFDGLTGAAIESHVRTAFHAMSVSQGNLQRQGRRT